MENSNFEFRHKLIELKRDISRSPGMLESKIQLFINIELKPRWEVKINKRFQKTTGVSTEMMESFKRILNEQLSPDDRKRFIER